MAAALPVETPKPVIARKNPSVENVDSDSSDKDDEENADPLKGHIHGWKAIYYQVNSDSEFYNYFEILVQYICQTYIILYLRAEEA